MQDDFYIGWQSKAPRSIRRNTAIAVAFLVLLAGSLALVLGWSQQTIGGAAFEWNTTRELSGIFAADPYPHLKVLRPNAAGTNTYSSYLLVRPFKFGLDPAAARRLDGHPVRLRGALIYRGNQTMIEVRDDSITAAPELPGPVPAAAEVSLGRQTLRGEIVDSKCYLGVMNPGQFIPHRACAIRCISGGIPPLFVVRQPGGPPLHFLLISPEGLPVNQQVLGFVAEPVEITGEIARQGELLILRADPSAFRRTKQ